jgi:hypothetical protein
MKKTIGVLIAVLAVAGGVAAAVAVGGPGDEKPITTTVKPKEPKSTGTDTTTTDETVTVEPGTVTVTDADDDVEQIEAVVTHEVPGVDESQIENIDVSGDKATAELDEGGTVSLRQEGDSWEPQQVERPSREPKGGERNRELPEASGRNAHPSLSATP